MAARELDGEMMIMSAVDSTLFTLNETATVIWHAADGKTALSEIVRLEVCREFEVEPDEAYGDALEFVEKLASHGVLLLSDAPIPETRAEVVKRA